MLWENLREEEFEGAIKASGKVCVVPIRCVEKHAQHLPVGTDVQTALHIAKEAAKLEPVVVAPPMYFGDIFGHTARGAIVLPPDLLLNLLRAYCSEIARNGFKKILFLNGHGGNKALLSYLCRCTSIQNDYVVMYRDSSCYSPRDLVNDLDAGSDFPELTEEDKAYVRDFVYSGKVVGHAGFTESVRMLKINLDAVNMDRVTAESGLATHRTDYLKDAGLLVSTRFWGVEYPNAYCGHAPERGNERFGAVILRKQIEAQAEACRLLKMDDRVLQWAEEAEQMRAWEKE